MKFFLLIFLSLQLASCASFRFPRRIKKESSYNASYTLEDISGKFRAKKEVIFKDKKTRLLSRFIIKDKASNQELEKTMAFSAIRKSSVKPILSQHTSWLDKQRFFSQIKYLPETKRYEVILDSPEVKWKGKTFVKVPSSKYQCFLSQLADCIKQAGVFKRFEDNPDEEIDIIVIWDNYPFYVDQYTGLQEKVYSRGLLRVDGIQGAQIRLALEVQNQVLFYTFDENYRSLHTYWVAQGYKLERNVVKKTNKGK